MTTRKIYTAGLLAGVLALAPGAVTAQGQYPSQGQSRYPSQTRQARVERLTGTFELDRARSDDPSRVADLAMRQVTAAERDRVSRRLANRLEPPDMLTLDRSGTQIRMASSRAAEMSFVADGRARVEQGVAGRRATTRASLVGERLEVSTRGVAGNDFTVTFQPMTNNTLRVTRRLFDERMTQPVVVQSVYRRVSDTPDWDVFDGYRTTNRADNDYDPNRDDRYGDNRYGDYRADDYRTGDSRNTSLDRLIPAGSTVIATLDQPLNARTARENERVTLTVHNAPRPELEGAIIEGRVAAAARAVNGRTGFTMEFDRIRLQDGRTADFAGMIESVRGVNGESIAYNGEQVETGRSQTEQAIQRGAIGAAIGAVIGAVAGGGQGAAIGAVIGGGGAAATVFVDQLNQSTLERGTEITIRTQRR